LSIAKIYPGLFQIENVLSENQCKKIIQASPFLKESLINNRQQYEMDMINRNSGKDFAPLIDVFDKYTLFHNPEINYKFIMVMRYQKNKGIIVRHKDTYGPTPEYEKKSYSILIYLNDVCEGGETVFFVDNKEIVIKPKTGRLLIISGDIEHEAKTPISNTKYVALSRHN
jgi:hypothetical protein